MPHEIEELGFFKRFLESTKSYLALKRLRTAARVQIVSYKSWYNVAILWDLLPYFNVNEWTHVPVHF